ncbi:MAG: hypothetical protein QW328_07135 [Nitrososphaerota archaeon]
MVKAVDIEGLMKKYVEENSLERADALYLLYTVGSDAAAKILRARYGRSGALSSVLDDLKALGVDKVDPYGRSEDTGECLRDIIQDSFKQICLDSVVESAKARATALSLNAREILYLISIMRPETVDTSSLRKFYKLLFQKTLTDYEFERALDELKGCYLIQYVSYGYLNFPPYFDDLLLELRDVIPRVEVKVLWPEKEM